MQDTQGVTLAQSDGNTITVTDQGALRAGVDIAGGAFDFGHDALSLADRSTGRALEFGEAVNADALSFAQRSQGDAFELSRDVLAEAVTFADRSAGRLLDATELAGERSESVFARAFEFGRDLFDSSINTVTGVLSEGQAQLGNTVTTLNQIARQQATTDSERVQDLASKTLYVGAVMVGLVMLAMFAMRAR